MIDDPELLRRFGASLGIGLLMGLVRERSPGVLAGLRTYALVALLGTVCAWLTQAASLIWLLPAGLLALGAMMIVAHQADDDGVDAGTTSTVAVLLCFALGAMAWLGPLLLVVALGLAATALLHFKPELHGFVERLRPADVRSLLRFAVVSLLVLPLLPDQGYGPYAALNPYRIGLMVVLISGLSLGGYLLLQLTGSRHGVLVMGLLGGLVSSTATSLSFARQVRSDPGQAGGARAVILLANLVVLPRLLALAVAVSPAALPHLAPVLGGGFLLGLAALAWALQVHRKGDAPELQIANPGEMRAALGFAALFAGVLLGVAWLEDWAGARGVFLAAAVSGLTDVDAISLSAMELFEAGRLDGASLASAVLIAYLANLAFKLALVFSIGGRELGRGVAGGFAWAATGLGLAWMVMQR